MWTYDGRSLYHDGMETEFPDLQHVHQLITDQTVGLLITIYGDLHLYIDGYHAERIATGLPVDKPLWGAVDALSSCTKVESYVLSGELLNFACDYTCVHVQCMFCVCVRFY